MEVLVRERWLWLTRVNTRFDENGGTSASSLTQLFSSLSCALAPSLEFISKSHPRLKHHATHGWRR